MCWVISWVVLLWFDVCWCYVVVWLGWCGIHMQAEALDSACIRIRITTRFHTIHFRHCRQWTNWVWQLILNLSFVYQCRHVETFLKSTTPTKHSIQPPSRCVSAAGLNKLWVVSQTISRHHTSGSSLCQDPCHSWRIRDQLDVTSY